MAFTVLPASRGKHRRARRGPARTGARVAGVAVLTAAGTFGAAASAAPAGAQAASHRQETGFAQAVAVSGSLSAAVAGQADAQHAAAVSERQAAAKVKAATQAAARAEAAAKARAKAAAAAHASQQAASRAAARAPLGTGWTLPVGPGAPIGTPYDAPGALWASGHHTGVDFIVSSGTSVHAVAAGTVVSAGWDGSYGYDVIIRHSDGRYTLYGHLTRPLVSSGQHVTEGERIGVSGATGNVTGPHLHFEVRTTPDYGSDIDPVAYLRGHGVTV